jgi:hypothetical protein
VAEIQIINKKNINKIDQHPSLRQQAEALVAAKITSLQEVKRVLGLYDSGGSYHNQGEGTHGVSL